MITDDTLSFTIPLEPVPASRARSVAGRPGYYPERYDTWRKEAAIALERITEDLPQLGDSPLEVWLEFVCKRPKEPTHPYPSKGDVDNLSKATLDAITKTGLWDDDMQVVTSHGTKRYNRPGEAPHTKVVIRPLELE